MDVSYEPPNIDQTNEQFISDLMLLTPKLSEEEKIAIIKRLDARAQDICVSFAPEEFADQALADETAGLFRSAVRVIESCWEPGSMPDDVIQLCQNINLQAENCSA